MGVGVVINHETSRSWVTIYTRKRDIRIHLFGRGEGGKGENPCVALVHCLAVNLSAKEEEKGSQVVETEEESDK